MFGRSGSTQLAVIVKPVIEQIAESLIKAGYQGLISDDRTGVASAAQGWKFWVYHIAEHNWIQFKLAMGNDKINYQTDDANKFNREYRWGKVYLNDDSSVVYLKLDLIYVRDRDITEILAEYISGWDMLVGIFIESLHEVNSRYEAEQEALKREPPKPRIVADQGEATRLPYSPSRYARESRVRQVRLFFLSA
jgi:hypothetical protein